MKRIWHALTGTVSSVTQAFPETVFVAVVKSSVPVPEIAQRVEADHTFRMSLPEGEFTLRAYAENGRMAGERTLTITGAPEEPIEIELRQEP